MEATPLAATLASQNADKRLHVRLNVGSSTAAFRRASARRWPYNGIVSWAALLAALVIFIFAWTTSYPNEQISNVVAGCAQEI